MRQYNGAPEGPRNIYEVILKSIRMQGFIASDHLDLLADFHRDVGGWVREGRVKWQETVVDSLENAPQAFLDLFSGGNLGKMLVRLAP